MAKKYLGIDMGGTRTRLGIIDEDLRIVDSEIVLTASYGKPSLEEGFASLAARFVQERGHVVDGAVVGVPATVDAGRRRVVQAPNVPGLSGLELASALERSLDVPAIVEKDVNLLLLSDMLDLGIDGAHSVVGIYFGTGIGNALYLNGDVWRGRHGVAGELGHVPQFRYEQMCGCGNKGCLECAGGGHRLAAIRNERFAGTDMDDLFVAHGDDPEIQEVLDAMAIAVAGEVTLIDPDEVVIGGGIPAMAGFDREDFERRVIERARSPYPANDLRLHYARQGQLSGIIGAGIVAKGSF